MLKGQEGQSIKGITKTGTDVLVDTYTITLTDGTTSTFTVTNGKGISSIEKTGKRGLVDTYTIKFNDGTNSTFTVTNGKEILSIDKTGTDVLVDTYTIEFNDGTTSTFTVTNGKGISNISKTETSGLVDTYTIEFNDGTTSTFTVTNGDSAYKPAVEALGKRIDNLILSSGTESSAEVVDARNGYDGTTYDTLGTAIRSQVSEIKDDLTDISNLLEGIDNYAEFEIGSINDTNGNLTTNVYRVRSKSTINIDRDIILKVSSGFAFKLFFYDHDVFIRTNPEWVENEYKVLKGTEFKIVITKTPEEKVGNNIKHYIDSVKSINKTGSRFINIEDRIDLIDKNLNGTNLTLDLYGNFTLGKLTGLENTNDLYRVSSTTVFRFDYDVTFKIADGFRCVLIIVSGDSYIDSGWKTGFYTIAKNKEFKICITKNPEERVGNNIQPYIDAITFNSEFENRLEKLELSNIENYVRTPWVKEIHRGIISQTIIENTIPALVETAKNGFHRLECDLRKTSDNVIIMCHDATISGTVNGEQTTYSVADTEWNVLSTLILSTNELYGDIHVPRFDEFLDKAYLYGLTLNLDLKEGLVSRLDVANLVVSHGMSGRCLYNTNSSASSTFDEILSIDKRARFVTLYNQPYIEEYISKYALDTIEIAVASANVTDSIATIIRNSGLRFMIYDVYNDSCFKYRPDVIQYTTLPVSDINYINESYMNSQLGK